MVMMDDNAPTQERRKLVTKYKNVLPLNARRPTPTRGQRPNESQKAVIIDMIKSVGEIASKMWPVV